MMRCGALGRQVVMEAFNGGADFVGKLTRSELEEKSKDLLERVGALAVKALAEAEACPNACTHACSCTCMHTRMHMCVRTDMHACTQIKSADVHAVVIVGGAVRMPAIQDHLKKAFEKETLQAHIPRKCEPHTDTHA